MIWAPKDFSESTLAISNPDRSGIMTSMIYKFALVLAPTEIPSSADPDWPKTLYPSPSNIYIILFREYSESSTTAILNS